MIAVRPPLRFYALVSFALAVTLAAIACESVTHSSDFATVEDAGTITVVGCPTGQTVCSIADGGGATACVALTSDTKNCGACGTACSASQTCTDGVCSCPANTVLCGSTCSDRTTDSANCGACGMACGPDSICQNSTCTPLCQTGQTNCTGFVATGASPCVDVSSDTANCGACGTSCSSKQLCSGSRCCVEGASGCKCDTDAGKTQCGDEGCFNLNNTYAHCGACDAGCVGTQECVNGNCSCPNGQILCGGACITCTGGSCQNDVCTCPAGDAPSLGYCCPDLTTYRGSGICCAAVDMVSNGQCCHNVTSTGSGTTGKTTEECCSPGLVYCTPKNVLCTGSATKCAPSCMVPSDCQL